MNLLARSLLAASLAISALVALSPSCIRPCRYESDALVRPGSTTAVTFTVGHGCDGSPTNEVVLRFPVGVAFVTSGAMPAGWSVTTPTTKTAAPTNKSAVGLTAGTTVTLRGPGLNPKRHHSFALTLRFPSTPRTLLIPTIQRCVKGSQDWISSSVDADYPAPRIVVR